MTRADALQQRNAGTRDTFRERGLAVPFTTPALCPGRLRYSRDGLELVMPNPSGKRGAYVVAWTDLREIAPPTVHDVQLCARLAAFARDGGAPMPADIRAIARAVALEGYAGRRAAAAAIAAIQQGARDEAAALAVLCVPPANAPSAGRCDHRLVRLLADIGVGSSAETAQLPRLLGRVEALARAAAAIRASADPAGDGTGDDLNALAVAAELVGALTRRALVAARARVANIPELLRGWERDADEVLAVAGRPDLLLDGWDRICAIYQRDGLHRGASGTVSEMSALLTVLPNEVDLWFAFPPGTMARAGHRPGPRRDHALPDRPHCASIARNEALRTIAA